MSKNAEQSVKIQQLKKSPEEMFGDSGISSNMEDYLEAIYIISRGAKKVRAKEIADALNIKMPSVTAAMNKLKTLGLIIYEKYGYVGMTGAGIETAERIYNRHRCLADFFREVLNLGHLRAEEEACRAEHVLSPETCVRFHALLDYYRKAERKNLKWTRELKKFFE